MPQPSHEFATDIDLHEMQKYIQRLTTGDRNALCPGQPYQQNVKFLSMIEYDFSNVLQGRYYLDADFNIACAELVSNDVTVEQVFYDPETKKKNGRARKFDPEGNLIYSGEFSHDKPVGMVWQITDGQRHEQFFTTAGKLQGRQTSTDADGNVASTFYRQGKKINRLSFWLDENIMDIIQGFNSRIFEPVGGFILRRKKDPALKS